MMWWIIGTVVFLVLAVFVWSLAAISKDADQRLAEMRDNDEYTRGG